MIGATALPARERLLYAGLAAFVAVIWFASLPARPLFNTDEGRYAEIPREMLAGGDWIVPHLNGLAYIEKPPLQYWATALSLRVFGANAFGARFVTALLAVATVLVVWLLARRLWGLGSAWRAAAVLSGMALFAVLGQLLTLDMSLTFFMTASLAGFLAAQGGAGAPPSGRIGARGYMLFAWAAAAAGVLTKGLVAAAIPLAGLCLYTAVTRDAAPWRRLHLGAGLPLFLAVSVPWHWLAARRLADFLRFYFVHEHLARYLTPSADREQSWWFFIPVLLAGTLPWTLSALRVLGGGWRVRTPPGEFNVRLFLWLWVAFVCVFFSLSDSKLIPYVLPALPALALLIAALPPAAQHRELSVAVLLTLLAAGVLAVAGVYWRRIIPPSERSPYFWLLAQPLLEVAAILAVSAAFVWVNRGRETPRGWVFIGAGWCLAVLSLMRAAALVAPAYSGAGLAAALDAADRAHPLYSVATYDQTLPFYLRRTVTLVAYRGELDYGLRHAPGAEIAGIDEFLAVWSADRPAFAVMEWSMFDTLKDRGVPMRELARDLHRVLVAR